MMVVHEDEAKVYATTGSDHTPPTEAWRRNKVLLSAFAGIAEDQLRGYLVQAKSDGLKNLDTNVAL
jgi:hypothetical protein